MEVSEIKAEAKERMDKSIHSFSEDLKSIRTGRASIHLLDHITIEAYGSDMPLNQVANLSAPEARMILIEPWDKTNIQHIEKAIQKSDLDLSPSNDGNVIRLAIPQLTEERRKELVKQVKKRAEDAKVAVRNIRRDCNEEIKGIEKEGHISKDDVKHAHDDIQKFTDDFIEKINQLTEKKDQEIMEI